MPGVIVLGGGPAGLYASLLLARRGIEVTVLEREQLPGGLSAGTEVAGVRVDYGSHRLHPSTAPDIMDDLRGLLGDDLQMRPRNGRMLVGESWLSFPISPVDLARSLGLGDLARLGLGAARASLKPSGSETFAEFIESGLGRPMGELFYYPYARKIWGIEPEMLSGEQARRRISADTPWKLLSKALSRKPTGKHFFYPSGGFGQIATRVAEAAVSAGAEVHLGQPVTGVRHLDNSWVVESAQRSHSADLVLSTLPITTLAWFLSPGPEVLESINSLKSRAMILAYLAVDVSQWTEYDAHYFPGEEVVFTRVSEPKNYRTGPDPDGVSVLCVEIPCDRDDPTYLMSDEALLSRVRSELVGLGLPDPGERGEVRRLPNAYPVYQLGSEGAFQAVSDWLDTKRGMMSFGRQGLFAHDNTHHAMAMARDAVACISDDLKIDEEAWLGARASFADHVVED